MFQTFDTILSWLAKHKSKAIVLIAALTILDILIFWQIFSASATGRDLKIYFFDVGQGDSQLVVLPGGVKVLIDGGLPNGRVLGELARALPPTDRYIDLVVMSHSQLDHFGGLVDVLKRYRVGAFLWNGREGDTKAFSELEKVIQENDIQSFVLVEGDTIRYEDSRFNVLMPTPRFLESKELNDTSFVLELLSNGSITLFTGDIGMDVEKELLDVYDLDIDVLKVAHHGSKYSSAASFLDAVRPRIAVIEVGRNSYGHPTRQTLDRLQDIGASVYRTDRDGTVELVVEGGSVKIYRFK